MSMAIKYAMKKRAKKMAEGGETETSTTGNKTKTGGSNPGGASTGGAGTVTITTGKNPPSIDVRDIGGRTDSRNAGGMDPSDENDDMMARGGKMCKGANCSGCEMCMADGGKVDPSVVPTARERAVEAFNKGRKDWEDSWGTSTAKPAEEVKEEDKEKKGYADGGFVKKEKASGYQPMPEDAPKPNAAAMREDGRRLGQHGMYEVAARGGDDDNGPHMMNNYAHNVENQDKDPESLDMVGHIMKQRAMHYAGGGSVDPDHASLVKRLKEENGQEVDKWLKDGEKKHEDMIGKIMEERSYSKGGRVANDTGDGASAGLLENQFDDLVLRDDLEQHYTGANSGDEIGNAQEDEDQRDMVAQIMKSRRKKDRLPNPR